MPQKFVFVRFLSGFLRPSFVRLKISIKHQNFSIQIEGKHSEEENIMLGGEY